MKKTVLIDLGNTLIYNKEIKLNRGYRYLYFELKEIKLSMDAFLNYANDLFNRLYKTRNQDNIEIPFQTFLRTLIAELNLKTNLSLEQLEQTFYDKAIVDEPMSGGVDFLTYLKKRQIAIYIISNSTFSSGCLVKTLKRFGILEYMNGVFSSADIGYRKPSPLLFDYIKELEGINKKETIMIGNDYYFDFEFAKAIQVDFLWYNAKNEAKSNDDFCYVAKNYQSLIDEWSEKFD